MSRRAREVSLRDTHYSYLVINNVGASMIHRSVFPMSLVGQAIQFQSGNGRNIEQCTETR